MISADTENADSDGAQTVKGHSCPDAAIFKSYLVVASFVTFRSPSYVEI